MSEDNYDRGAKLLFGIFGTVLFTGIASCSFSEIAEQTYIIDHQITSILVEGWFGPYYREPVISFGRMEFWRIFAYIILPTILFLISYPYVGKFIFDTLHKNHVKISQILETAGELSSLIQGSKIAIAAFWPVAVFVLPLQLIALIILRTFRSSGL